MSYKLHQLVVLDSFNCNNIFKKLHLYNLILRKKSDVKFKPLFLIWSIKSYMF